MTIPQIQGFMTAIGKKQATERVSFVSNVAIGAQGTSSGIKDTIKNYTEQINAFSKSKKKRKPK